MNPAHLNVILQHKYNPRKKHVYHVMDDKFRFTIVYETWNKHLGYHKFAHKKMHHLSRWVSKKRLKHWAVYGMQDTRSKR